MRSRATLDLLRRTGLCAILDDGLAGPDGLVRLAGTLSRAGVRVFQLRVKSLGDGAAYRLAVRLRSALRGGSLLVNDRCDLALACGADGVHLGQEDLPAPRARGLLGRGAVVGLSAGTPAEMSRALGAGPDYVSIGPAYRTGTKRDAGRPLELAGFRRLARRVPRATPVLAVGGVTPDNVGVLLDSGADAVAAASCWTRSRDPGGTARDILGIVAAAKRRRPAGRSRSGWELK